jgi:hypothetical protein
MLNNTRCAQHVKAEKPPGIFGFFILHGNRHMLFLTEHPAEHTTDITHTAATAEHGDE